MTDEDLKKLKTCVEEEMIPEHARVIFEYIEECRRALEKTARFLAERYGQGEIDEDFVKVKELMETITGPIGTRGIQIMGTFGVMKERF